MAIKRRKSKASVSSNVPDSKDIMRKLNNISKKKDSLLREQSKLEVEGDNLKEELEDLEEEVKAEFGTLDQKMLDKHKADLLKEAEKLLEKVDL